MAAPALFSTTSGIDRVFVLGSQLSGDIKEALLSADFDTSFDQVSQLTMKFVDPGWKIMASGLLLPGLRVDLEDYRLEIATLDTEDVNGTEGFTIKCRPQSVRGLKNARGAHVLKNVSPSEYVQRECSYLGIAVVAQPSSRRSQIARDVPDPGQTYSDPPSAWTTFKRLADEVGYVLYEIADTIYFGKPTWLINNVQLDMVKAGYKTTSSDVQLDEIPRCSKSADSAYTTLDLTFPTNSLDHIRPGKRLNLQGVPLFNGQYIVSGMSIDLADPAARLGVTAETPHDPEPHPPSTDSDSSSTSRTGTKSSEDFVYWAMKQIGDRYVFGAPVLSPNTDPKTFDCSSLVKWSLSKVGVTSFPRVSEAQISYCASKGGEISVSKGVSTRGALLWHSGHVAISLGNGKTVEAANSRVGVIQGTAGSRFKRAAKIPGLSY